MTSQYGNNPTYAFLRDASIYRIPQNSQKSTSNVKKVDRVIVAIYLRNNQKLLVNKQIIKTGFDEIPNLHGLIDAINKKEGESQYLADLKQIRKAYALDVKEIYPNNSIPQNSEMSTPTAKKVPLSARRRPICFSKQWKTVG